MADPAQTSERSHRFLTFRAGQRLYALPGDDVAEVIRMPLVARVPQGPKSLLGLANLRGAVVPVVSVRTLLGQPGENATTRAIILGGTAPVALAVEHVEALADVAPERIESDQVELAARPGELLTGAFKTRDGQEPAYILDIAALLQSAFAQRASTSASLLTRSSAPIVAPAAADHREKLVTFDVCGQEFALTLTSAQEIIEPPTTVAAMPQSEALVLGVIDYRSGLLPVLSLRGLLGFPLASRTGHEKIIVTRVHGVLVGIVADRMRAIVSADTSAIEQTPSLLAARMGGESHVHAIYRADGGRRLVSILDPERLFREDVMQRLAQTSDGSRTSEPKNENAVVERRFVVFRLAADEFCLPIESVDEVANVPEQITRVPKTPRFLEGVVNLRGDVLPVIDQRKRFDMPTRSSSERRRLIVVRTGKLRAGLVVDSVSEVLRVGEDAIALPPELTGDITRLVQGVINLDSTQRMVLILDPAELLTRAERNILNDFTSSGQTAE